MTTLLAAALSLLLCGPAFAGPAQDLAQAADPDLPKAARMQAFERLVAVGSTDLGVVQKAALDTKSADTRSRWVAIRVLGKVGGPRARQLLVQLASDPEPAIRAAALQAMGDTGDRSLEPEVVDALGDPAVIVRAGAAAALCSIGSGAAVDPLSTALDSRDSFYRGSSLWVRRHYIETMGCIGSRKALPALLRTLDDRDTAVAEATLGAFAKIAGFDYAEGRDAAEQREAWRRWAQAQLR